jgi:putative hydrolase
LEESILKLVIDTHTHTVSSGHSYSTIAENAKEAALNEMEGIAMTDHGPSITGAPTLLHFMNLRVIPETIQGVRIFKGAEVNILDYRGTLDIPVEVLARLEFVNASYHDITIEPATVEEHTEGLVSALKNPYVDAVAHPGNPVFQVDIDTVVKTAAEYGKLIEINNSSFRIRRGCEGNCMEFIRKCRQYGARITCGSDAHICYDIGRFDRVLQMLQEAQMPEELVINTSLSKMEAYVKERKASKRALLKVK